MKPYSLAFNAACVAMASRVCPKGFDVSGKDTDKPAPSSLEELNVAIGDNGRLVVDGDNSECTIFADAETNYAFRAWHDWTHWILQAPFSLEGECKVACQQVAHLRDIYGATFAKRWAPAIYEEVIGQALAKEISGEFPNDQVAFAQAFLALMERPNANVGEMAHAA